MRKDNIPLHAIIELVIRISEINPTIGQFIDFRLESEDSITVRTSTGNLRFPVKFALQQSKKPRLISRLDLTMLSYNFEAL